MEMDKLRISKKLMPDKHWIRYLNENGDKKHLDLAGGLASYGGGSSGALWEHPLSTDSFYPYQNKRAAFADKSLTFIPCPACRKSLESSKWVTKVGNLYISLAKCEEHGEFIGRIKFSHVSDNALSCVRNVFKGSKFATEYYEEVFAKSEKRKEKFKERMKEQRKAKKEN